MFRKVKVLMVTTHFPPSIGGVEKHVLMLSKVLQKRGCEVLVYTQTPGPPRVDGIQVVRARRRIKFDGWLHCLRRLELFRWADVVHVHNPHALLSLALPARLLLPRKPFVITLHGYTLLPPPRRDVVLQRLSASLCRKVFCVGKFVAEWYGLRKGEVIWGATEIPPLLHPFPGRPTLAYVGRLDIDRPVVSVVLAASFSGKMGVSVKLLLAGGGPMEEDLRRLTRDLGLEAEFMGWVPNPRPIIRRAHLLIASGYLSSLEAMSEGRPVVAIARDRWEEDYWRGFPCPFLLVRSGKEAGRTLTSLLGEEGALHPLSSRSRQAVSSFTWENLAWRHIQIYKRLLRSGV